MSRISLAGLTAALLLIPPALAGQTGTITYERSATRTRAALFGDATGGGPPGGARPGGAPGGRVPGGRVPPQGAAPGAPVGGRALQEYATLTVSFDGTTALTRIEPLATAEGAGGREGFPAGEPGQRRIAGDGAGVARLQAGLRARGLPGLPLRTTTALWVDAATGEKVEAVDFMTREFRVVGQVAPLAWRLLGEESEYLGYVVQKAVAERDSATIEAWFTVDVPGFAAPEDYTGLPGVVLMVSVNRGETLIQAVDVQTDGPVEAVARPTDGDEITAGEFDALVAEKTEEFRAEMQSRRRGGGGDA